MILREPGGGRPWPLIILVAALGAAGLAAGAALYLRLSGDDGVVLSDATSYTEAVVGSPQWLNPLFAAANDVDQDLVQLLFSGLVRIGPDGTVVPDLAELPQVSEDGRTYTFHLKRNLSWHDGQPLTSRDVAFTIALVTDPDFKGEVSLAESWTGVEVAAPDDATVVFRLKQPSAPFAARNATLGILPEHLLRNLPAQALRDAPFNTAPVGSGPYRLAGLDAAEVRLAANGHYHLGTPAIATLRFRFFPDYPAATRAFVAHEVDALFYRGQPSPTERTELARVKNAKGDEFQRAGYLVLYLNNDQVAYFADPGVRRAISLAIDRQALVDEALAKLATASSSAIGPATWAYAQEYDGVALDLAEARKLLDAAGWKADPTTNILVRGGEEFRFTIRTDGDPARSAVAAAVAGALDQLGIRATVATTTFSVLQRDFLKERRYDAAIAGWDQGPDPDPYFGWHSSQGGAAGLNFANFGDIVVDQLIAKARTTADREVRVEQYRQFQEKWADLAPSVILAYPHYLFVHSDALQGVTPGVLARPSQRFFDVQRWHN